MWYYRPCRKRWEGIIQNDANILRFDTDSGQNDSNMKYCPRKDFLQIYAGIVEWSDPL